jgi:parvulin-like peptidyl-prolyl isomerase
MTSPAHELRRVWALSALVLAGCVAGQSGQMSVSRGEAPRPAGPPEAGSTQVALLQPPGTGQPPTVPRPAQVVPPPGPVVPASLSSRPDPGHPRLTVRAWVNGKPIFDEDLLKDAAPALAMNERYPEPQRSANRLDILKQHLQKLIERELILQDAFHKLEKNKVAMDRLKEAAEKQFNKKVREWRSGAGGDQEFKEALRAQGMTLEELRKNHEREFIAQTYVGSRIGPIMDGIGLPQVREYYDQHQNEFQTVDRAEWQDIFVAVGPRHATPAEARRFAGELVARLRAGEDFARLMQYDDGDSRQYRNGRGAGERRGEIKPAELEAHLWNMKDGEVGLLELSTGVHVYRLLKRHHAGQLPLDEKVQAQIRTKLKNEIFVRERKLIVRELTARAVIEVVSTDRNPLP